MKKTVTVLTVLTPVMFLVWALAFCLCGIVDSTVAFNEYLASMFEPFKTLGQTWGAPQIMTVVYLVLTFLVLVYYFVVPPIRKRFGYMWHSILLIVAAIPMIMTMINADTYQALLVPATPLGAFILNVMAISAAALTTGLMMILWLLSLVDMAHAFAPLQAESPHSSTDAEIDKHVVPSSEPIEEGQNNDLLTAIRQIVREELAKTNLPNNEESVDALVEKLPEEVTLDWKQDEPTPTEDEIIEVKPNEEVVKEDKVNVAAVAGVAAVVEGAAVAAVVANEPEASDKPIYERISFMDRMINADEEMKQHYNELKNIIMSYGVKSRVSNSGDAFRLHTKTYVKLTIAGKSLKLYFALDPKDYKDTKLPIQDASSKAIYAEIPLVFKVKSDLSMKRAKDLINDAMSKDKLAQGEIGHVDYIEELKQGVVEDDDE